MEFFATKRQQIAISHETKDAQDFGRRRDEDKEPHFTYLDLQYVNYGDPMKIFFAKFLKGEIRALGNEEYQIHFRTLDIPTYKGLLQKEIHSVADIEPINPDLVTAGTYAEYCGAGPSFHNTPPSETRLVAAKAIWDPKNQNIAAAEYIHAYMTSVPIDQSVQLLLSKPTYLPLTTGCVILENRPCVLIRHMSNKLVEPCLAQIAAIFERIVKRENPASEVLKADLAELRYRFSFVMPYARGSSAIAGWLEKTLCELHGYKSATPKEIMVDVQALTTPYFPNFRKKYMEELTLSPLS